MSNLFIIGASNLQLPLVLKSKELGLISHVFAWEEGAVAKKYADKFYPISITEKEKILSYAKDIKPDGVISIASDLATLTVSYIAQNLGLIGNSINSSLLTTNKYLMRERLSNFGLPCPKYLEFSSESEIQNVHFNFPMIVKPVDRSGSRGVTKASDESELLTAVNRAINQSFSGKAIIEEYIIGREVSVEMISWKGEHTFLQMTDKITTGSPYYVEKEHHQPSDLDVEIQSYIIKIVKNALSSLEIEYGASHSEILITNDNNIYIVEIGGRMGGDFIGSHLVPLSTGYDYLKNTINISLNIPPENFNPVNKNSGVIYQIPRPGKVFKIIDNTNSFPEIIHKELYYQIGDRIPEVKESNDRASCFIYRSKERFSDNREIIKYIIE